MAKNAIPGLQTGPSVLAKLVGIGISIAIIVLVVQYPGDSATWVKQALSMAGDAIHGLVTFIRTLSS